MDKPSPKKKSEKKTTKRERENKEEGRGIEENSRISSPGNVISIARHQQIIPPTRPIC